MFRESRKANEERRKIKKMVRKKRERKKENKRKRKRKKNIHLSEDEKGKLFIPFTTN